MASQRTLGGSLVGSRAVAENPWSRQISEAVNVISVIFAHCAALQTPSWLEGMIAHQKWRQLFYKLAEEYPDCLMLNFTIKVITAHVSTYV